MQKPTLLRILVLLIGFMGSSIRAQYFETSQPIENLLTRATIDKIPVGRSEPLAHHVLMELPIVKAEIIDEEIVVTESPYAFVETETEKVNPYASSGILTPQQRQQRFKSLRPSYPFAKRRGSEKDPSFETTISTTENPSTTVSDQGLKSGSLRSRFRFRPSLLSSKGKNKIKEDASTTTTTTEGLSTVESKKESSPKTRFPFRRSGGVSDLIRRNRPSFRRKSTTTVPITTPLSPSTERTTFSPETFKTSLAPTTVWFTTESDPTELGDLFDFDTPINTFTPSSIRERTGIPLTTTLKSTTFDVPKIQSTTLAPFQLSSLEPTKPSSRPLLKRRRRPRPSANIVPVSNKEEKDLLESSLKEGHSKPLRFRGKRIKGRRVRGNRRRRPIRTTTVQEVTETTTAQVPETRPPSRIISREKISPSSRSNARSDFQPIIFEEQPRSSKIITQSSIQRKIQVPLIEEKKSSPVVRRDNKFRLKMRRNRDRFNEIERYSFEEEDGSFTWGYKAKDGSFKEETRGVDCITRGRYGYIDDTGEIREYKYESGVPCKEEKKNLANLEARGIGYFDYTDNRFVFPDGRRVKVQINQKHRARG